MIGAVMRLVDARAVGNTDTLVATRWVRRSAEASELPPRPDQPDRAGSGDASTGAEPSSADAAPAVDERLLTVVQFDRGVPKAPPTATLPYRLVVAHSGREALRVLRTDEPVEPRDPDHETMRRFSDVFDRGRISEILPAGAVTLTAPSVPVVEDAPARVTLAPLPEPGLRHRLQRQLGPVATGLFWSLVAFVAIFRFLVLWSGEAPATIDSGNWLAFADALLGDTGRDASITYPPLVPLLTKGFVSLMGVSAGVAAMGAMSSLAPALGLYWSLGQVGLGRRRVVPATLMLTTSTVGEAAAWGGFPQLLGLGLLSVGILAGWRALDEPSRRNAGWMGLVLLLALAVSHFMAVVLIASLSVATVVRAAEEGFARDWCGRVLRMLPIVVLPSLLLAPTYVKLVDAVFFHTNEFADLDNLSADNALDRLDGVYSELPVLWELLLPLALLAPIFRFGLRKSEVYRFVATLMPATLLLLLLTRESRYLHLVPLVCAMGVAVYLIPGQTRRRLIDTRPVMSWVAASAIGLVLVAQVHAGLAVFDDHRDFYGVLDDGLVEAIDVAGDHAGPDGVIAVPSLGDAPIGWWVEALTEGRVIYGSPLRWLNFPDELERAAAANAVFDVAFPDRDSLGELRDLGVTTVIIPRSWAWFDDGKVNGWIDGEDLELLDHNVDAVTVALD